MEQNEMATQNLLDSIRENASLLVQLKRKAQEKKQDTDLVNNCIVAMRNDAPEYLDLFQDLESIGKILDYLDEGLSSVEAFNKWLGEYTDSMESYTEEEMELLSNYYCRYFDIDMSKLEEFILNEGALI